MTISMRTGVGRRRPTRQEQAQGREPSMTAASFQLPGLTCFGGGFLSLILPKACEREGVTDFLVEATLIVASSSVAAGQDG